MKRMETADTHCIIQLAAAWTSDGKTAIMICNAQGAQTQLMTQAVTMMQLDRS